LGRHIGLTSSPLAGYLERTMFHSKPGFRAITSRPPPPISNEWGHPLTSFSLFFRVFTNSRCTSVYDPSQAQVPGDEPPWLMCHLSRFCSLQRFQHCEASSLRYVPRNKGPCVLRVSHSLNALLLTMPARAYFISNPLLGFTLQGFVPPPMPYALTSVATSLTFRAVHRSKLRYAFEA